MVAVLGFGDSLMYGAWDAKGGFINRLREFLEKKSKENFVFNLGIPIDETSNKLIKRFEFEAKARTTPGFEKENVILFSIGTNDSMILLNENKVRVPEEEFESNIRKLISLSRNFSSKIIFLGLLGVDESKTNPIPWANDKAYKNEYIKKYDGLLEKICKEEKVIYIKLFGKIKKEFFSDGVHPNSEGHKIIFEEIRKFFEYQTL